jgi:DNA-binding transcriptional regulator YdaS (Cro superfamily)
MTDMTGIQRAVQIKGSPAKLAEAVGNGVLRQHVEHWLKAGRVSAEKAPDVSAATGIPVEELNDKVNWSLVRSPAKAEA